MIFSIFILIIGFILLIKCADLLVDGSSNLARALGVSSLVIGLTIVAFGTSAPEAAVSVIASLSNKNDISLGNVIGSNICNLLLVLGFSGLFGKLTTERKIIERDFTYTIFSFIVLIIIMLGHLLDNGNMLITRTNGIILLCFLTIYLYALLLDTKKEEQEKETKTKFHIKDIIFIILGLIGIVAGGQLVVNGATDIAKTIGISEKVIALTIVAIGTSLPELVTGVVAVKKGETDLAIGNVLGSCIFNILFILGISSTVSPIKFNNGIYFDLFYMLFSGLLVFILVLKNKRIGEKKGLLLVLFYVLYICYLLAS